ncbi:hypothetical protein BLNAU_22043 [Blattamonas nauphoetae]|uniref:Uncharacterized protein n=1 Tax=Blattamonas nauphoetae TaxID=2049346 RepID=A0ABQ9WWF1_9EUKA|nr:hypothetical protein BLNAU_22043 [Blattamonas nauphoetae]
MRIGVQKGASRQRHIQPVLPHHSPLSDHSNPNQVHSFVGLVSSNGKKRVCGGVSVPASTVAFRELTSSPLPSNHPRRSVLPCAMGSVPHNTVSARTNVTKNRMPK